MKYRSFLVLLLLSLFFLGTQSSAFEASDTIVIVYDTSLEAFEQTEEIEDKRNFFCSAELSYMRSYSSVISYRTSFLAYNYFMNLHKPPIFS